MQDIEETLSWKKHIKVLKQHIIQQKFAVRDTHINCFTKKSSKQLYIIFPKSYHTNEKKKSITEKVLQMT